MVGSLEILEGGLLTTIQDGGRSGYLKLGVPRSGVMDEHAYHIANWLALNPSDSPVLEITLQAPVIRFKSQAIIGIAGADVEVLLNDEIVRHHQSIEVNAEDVLSFGDFEKGCRVYLAIHGEWDLQKIMGSYSTCLIAHFGGYEGRALQTGDQISWVAHSLDREKRTLANEWLPHFANRQQIRIIPGPEWEWLTEEQKEQFLFSEFTVSSQSNRMGVRLHGKKPIVLNAEAIRSAPVSTGMIQLPNGGHPIVLMNDAQSVGGYPRIAKIIDADLWRVGQIWTSTIIKFKAISYKKAKSLSAFRKNLLLSLYE